VSKNTDNEILYEIYTAALNAMKNSGPSPLARRIAFESDEREAAQLADPSVLITHLAGAPVGDRLLVEWRLALASWDAEALGDWVAGTEPRTVERRSLIYQLLGIGQELSDCFESATPPATDTTVVISHVFEPWYGRVMAERTPFYWEHYADYLASKRWDPDAIASLGLNTQRIVERLGDPERTEAYQAKGLVVGYVQSGKTANFTGVIARAVDAGYRLIIVLSGTTNLLRAQTQRRLDKELAGYENMMRGIDESDEEAVLSVDYHDDPDWDDFVKHGGLPSDLGFSDIHRLTTYAGDYKALKQGIAALDFEPVDKTKSLNAPINLHRLPTRIAVVKKNKAVLSKLVQDLKKISPKLPNIPAIIIDDESDQASINTSDPKKWAIGQKDRTAINGLIAQLLGLLPRSQYVGYTATPFANVFVDPGDAIDIFPRDFVISLDRPPGYMGAREYHDLEPPGEDEVVTFKNSNEKAFVRPINDEEPLGALQEAIDMYVLTGMVKLFRESVQPDTNHFEHHTMLIHESHRIEDHRALAEEVRRLWKESGYAGKAGNERLAKLFASDVMPVVAARHVKDSPTPHSFAEISPFLGKVTSNIEGAKNDPVMIVNGDKEAATEDVAFDQHPVWRILVGGTKLSRGFTIEGLTVAYYRRVTKQADTLMQMGRWFGFRSGYEDLVRLYISKGGAGATVNLYKSFEATCRSEALFREEIKKYATVKDGVPTLTPAQVQPLVAQYMTGLRPAAANKMYNAILVERRSPGEPLEPTGYPEAADALAVNTRALMVLVDRATSDATFSYPTANGAAYYPARYGTIAHSDLLTQFGKLSWLPDDHFKPDLKWLAELKPEQLEDWVVMLPQHKTAGRRATVADRPDLSVIGRVRRRPPRFGAISDPKHRYAASRIAGFGTHADPVAGELRQPRRGAVLVYPMLEKEESDPVPPTIGSDEVVMAVVIFAPTSTGSPDDGLVRFAARDSSKKDDPIIDVGSD
jgi:Z1 domain